MVKASKQANKEVSKETNKESSKKSIKEKTSKEKKESISQKEKSLEKEKHQTDEKTIEKTIKVSSKKIKETKENKEKKESKIEPKNDAKVKAIIFDFWGTLMDEGVRPSLLRQTKYFMNLPDMSFHDFIVKFENTVMTKKFADKKDAFVEACNAFDIAPKPFIIDRLIGLWNKSVFFAKPYEDMVEALEELRKDYKIILLSNNTNFSAEPVFEKYQIQKYFDKIYVSYETGLLKTNQQSFKKILDELNLDAKEAVMVGDSLETDIKGAEAAGIRAILIDRRDKREYHDKIRSLLELKKKLE